MPEHPNLEEDGYGYEDTSDEREETENQSNDEQVPTPQETDGSGPQPKEDIQATSHPGDDTSPGLQKPIPTEEKLDEQVTDISDPAKKDHTSTTGEEKSQTSDFELVGVPLLEIPKEKLEQLRTWHM